MSFDFYRLRNGVRVMLVPMTGVESVAVGVYIGTGSRYETSNNNGISHFLEHMVFKGTKKFPTHKDTSYLEGLGAIQNAWTDIDATCYWCKIPADYWEKGLEMVKELALWPTIPSKDLEIERGVILEEINRKEDRPDEIAAEELQGLMFGEKPLGMTILGQPEVIKRVSRKDFVGYHSAQYVSGNLVVAMAGKLEDNKIRLRIEKWFGEMPLKMVADPDLFVVKQKDPVVKVTFKKLAAQAHVELGVPGLTYKDPRRFALSILTAYLGQGLSSRLFIELREKRGLCYAVRADEERWKDTGVWSVYAGLSIDKLEQAIMAIIGELNRVKEVKLTQSELIQTKEKLRGPTLFSMENPISQMNFYAKQALDRPEEILTYDQLIGNLMQIDSESVRQVARDILAKDKINLAVVGPVDKRREQGLVKLLEV
ncbi:MAG: Peptidase M16 domain protein [Candidatus Amesbacteria bacterium GW2011_GWB1_47_19]|nr:MAG: Peptidase M16 domain protein [Candidatus Amesbacteria bacterium GW2011_GWA1_44_24]KKU31513.1 MAG: Peptidase M16 domain protein [Candidatus Amesbacteria bacterium GW2011_GWC1_46_24]KKU67521.1 MAG: Peptidase M16 domain protein [Candidatus Amesbacteria bacterium GW2011_GWB1_47_19]OGD06202.1 MAG: hypothetical protein A2379_01350 [Candidatus Amesbacteria bacterium RIFOXYB1_FULL_47_13]HBC72533.1 hypothetical protein [Candidatus Amesbacteria bacterium]